MSSLVLHAIRPLKHLEWKWEIPLGGLDHPQILKYVVYNSIEFCVVVFLYVSIRSSFRQLGTSVIRSGYNSQHSDMRQVAWVRDLQLPRSFQVSKSAQAWTSTQRSLGPMARNLKMQPEGPSPSWTATGSCRCLQGPPFRIL